MSEHIKNAFCFAGFASFFLFMALFPSDRHPAKYVNAFCYAMSLYSALMAIISAIRSLK